MPNRKCCVVGCDSTYQTHRLFNLPKKDYLRNLWLTYLVPYNVELSGMTKSQLLNKHVCEKHFDEDQFDCMGKRLAYGYPCLFTEKEMLYGVPLRSVDEHNVSDHNYASQPNEEDDNLTASAESAVINGEDYKNIHNYILPEVDDNWSITPDSPRSETIAEDFGLNQPASTLKPVSIDLVDRAVQTTSNAPPKRYYVKRGACSRSFVKRKSTGSKVEKEKAEGVDAATKLSHLFIRNFSKMSRRAQVFLLMQLKTAGRKKKALRYTMDEKLLIMSMMKENPEGFTQLQSIFNLPTKRTLDRLTEQVRLEVKTNNT